MISKKHYGLFLLILLLLILMSIVIRTIIREATKEPIPFFDGMYLKYEIDSETWTYKVRKLENGNFEVEMIGLYHPTNEITDKQKFVVNNNGKIIKSSDRNLFRPGRQTKLWLPRKYRKKDTTILSRRGVSWKTVKIDTWKKWKVCVCEASGLGVTSTSYYDVKTGFLVGIGTKRVLIETNAPIEEITE